MQHHTGDVPEEDLLEVRCVAAAQLLQLGHGLQRRVELLPGHGNDLVRKIVLQHLPV